MHRIRSFARLFAGEPIKDLCSLAAIAALLYVASRWSEIAAFYVLAARHGQ